MSKRRSFHYEAVDERGETVEGTVAAEGVEAVGGLLRRSGLTLVRVRHARGALGRNPGVKRMPDADTAALAHYVTITTRAGLPVVDGIEDFAREHPSPRIRSTLETIVTNVRNGAALSEAFEAQGRVFSRDFLSMLRAGEASGTLDSAMTAVAEQLRFRQDVRAQVKQALVQPAILMVAVGGLIVLLITFLLPRILALLTENGAELPAPTRMLMALSDGLRSHGLWLVAALVALIVLARRAARTERGRLLLGRGVLHLPGVGAIVAVSSQARFVSTMVTLLESGVDAVTSLRLASETTGSAVLERQLLDAADRVAEGHTLTEAMEPIPGMHPLVRSMIRLGERSGSLTETLATAVTYFAGELPRRIKQGVALIEPAIIAVSGLLVAFILLSVLLPIFSLYESF